MRRRPPRSTRTDTLFPYSTLFRSGYTAALDVVEEGRIGDALLRGAAHVALEEVEQSEQQQDDNDPERGVPAEIQGLMSLLGSRRQGAGPEASGRPLWPPVL